MEPDARHRDPVRHRPDSDAQKRLLIPWQDCISDQYPSFSRNWDKARHGLGASRCGTGRRDICNEGTPRFDLIEADCRLGFLVFSGYLIGATVPPFIDNVSKFKTVV